ncbi:DUF6442 family protein [Enterococcus sp. LJL128]|uniref:DUF6442 family protein n=1 Tax=Enterococcus sp. LJL51 TaxID=3416656 RepID=UPI003CFB37B8
MKFWPKAQAHNSKDYRAILQRRRLLFIGMIAASLLIGSLSFLLFNDEHTSSYLNGMSVGLGAVGILMFIQNNRMLKNEKKMEKNRREEFDERNVEINTRAMVLTARIFIFILAVTAIICGFINPGYSVALSVLICLFLVLYVIASYYYQKKM